MADCDEEPTDSEYATSVEDVEDENESTIPAASSSVSRKHQAPSAKNDRMKRSTKPHREQTENDDPPASNSEQANLQEIMRRLQELEEQRKLTGSTELQTKRTERLLSTDNEDSMPTKLRSADVIDRKSSVCSKKHFGDDNYVDSNEGDKDRQSSRQSKQTFKESCLDEDFLDCHEGEKQRSAQSILRRPKTKLSYRRQQPDDSEQDERLTASER